MQFKVEYHIYEERTKQGLSIRDLAEKAGISKTQINDIENGTHEATVKTLCQIAYALNVAPEKLFSFRVSDISDK